MGSRCFVTLCQDLQIKPDPVFFSYVTFFKKLFLSVFGLEGPDYRLYKSEPELTTVTEVDENNGEDRSEHPSDREHLGSKGML